MPFYEYECPSCRYYLEVLQKISDAPLKKCPSCRKAGFKRLMSAPVFRLKGSGWYETDFKSDKEGQRNLAGAEPAEPKETGADAVAKAGGEDKAAAKPEAAAPGADAAKADSAKAAANKPEAAPQRRAKRTVKRPVVRAARKNPRAAKKRGSRRR